MANVIDGGGTSFDYLLYGERDRGTTQFLHSMRDTAMQNLGSGAMQFATSMQQTVDRFYDSAAMRLARAAVRKVASLYQIDEIYELENIGQLQHAPPKMVPFVMAEPTLRTMFHKQQVEGYGDDYYDEQPGVVGEGHREYELVMDGIFVPDPDDAEAEIATSYLHLEEDELLDHDQQMDVMMTWEQVRIALAKGKEDPTSRFNATLG
jgi:hypothetical protein